MKFILYSHVKLGYIHALFRSTNYLALKAGLGLPTMMYYKDALQPFVTPDHEGYS